jgi:hypothetical protein
VWYGGLNAKAHGGINLNQDDLCDQKRDVRPEPIGSDCATTDAGHRQTVPSPLERTFDQGGDVVAQQNPGFVGCVREHLCVASPTEPDVLHPDDIEMGDAALKPAQNVVVEVLVREEPNHRPGAGGRRASRRARIPCGGEWPSIVAWIARAASKRFAT